MTNRSGSRVPEQGADQGRFRHPPGPPDPPIVGKSMRYVRDPIELMEETARYGDLAMMSVRPWLVYLVNHPDLIHEVLVTNNHRVSRWRNVSAFKHLMGEGLVTSDDPLHLRQRRIMQPQFHHSMIDGYSKIMTQYTVRHSRGWRHDKEADISREMRELTLNIVAKTLFSIDLPSEVLRLGKAFELSNKYISTRFNQFEWMNSLYHRLPLPLTIQFKRELAYLDRLVYGLMEQRRRSNEENGDLLSLMVQASDGGQGAGQDAHMTNEQVRDEIITMFAVGHETVTVALTWTWYLLSTHPEVQARFHAELDQSVGRSSSGSGGLRSPEVHPEGHQGIDAAVSANLEDRPPCPRAL